LAAMLFAVPSASFAARSPGYGHSWIHPTPAHHTEAWVEGVTPRLEDRLFDATYRVLPNHNVLKVYVFDAGGYQAAGIRFSGRVPHTHHDLSAEDLDHEAVALIRTTFAEFPEVQTLDVWATIPVSESLETKVESTVFSVSADRTRFEALDEGRRLTDSQFLDAFGRIWVAPEVPPE